MSKEAYYETASESRNKNGSHPLRVEEIQRAPSIPCTVFFFEKSETRSGASKTPRIVYNGGTENLRDWLAHNITARAWMVNRMAHALALRKHFEELWHGEHEGGSEDKKPNRLCSGCRAISAFSSRTQPLLGIVQEYLAESVTFT